MKRRWIRVPAGKRERGVALGVSLGLAAGVGLISFYLARLFLAREEIRPLDREKP